MQDPILPCYDGHSLSDPSINNYLNHSYQYGDIRRARLLENTYQILIQVAKLRGTITYSDLARRIGMSTVGNNFGRQMGMLLGAAFFRDYLLNQPIHASLVVRKDGGTPGIGYYNCAISFDLIRSENTATLREAFWQSQVNRVYDFWHFDDDIHKLKLKNDEIITAEDHETIRKIVS